MPEELRNIGEEYQRLSRAGFHASVRSFAEVNKGFQALTAEMTDYSKRAFEIQSQYVKQASDSYMSEMSKLGERYVAIARNISEPVEQATARTARKVE